MAYQVEWSPRAIEDVEAIALYIAAGSTAYAAAVVKKILDTTRKLSHFPLAGRVVPEFDDENIRENSPIAIELSIALKARLSQSRQLYMADGF